MRFAGYADDSDAVLNTNSSVYNMSKLLCDGKIKSIPNVTANKITPIVYKNRCKQLKQVFSETTYFFVCVRVCV